MSESFVSRKLTSLPRSQLPPGYSRSRYAVAKTFLSISQSIPVVDARCGFREVRAYLLHDLGDKG